MNRITAAGNLPPPVRKMGLLGDDMEKKLQGIRAEVAKVDTNLANILAVGPEVWECRNVYELSMAATFEECEHQVLVDRDTARYYLCAMSVDPERTRTRVDGPDIVEDEGPRSPMVLFFTEVGEGEYHYWQRADMGKRRDWIRAKATSQRPDVDTV